MATLKLDDDGFASYGSGILNFNSRTDKYVEKCYLTEVSVRINRLTQPEIDKFSKNYRKLSKSKRRYTPRRKVKGKKNIVQKGYSLPPRTDNCAEKFNLTKVSVSINRLTQSEIEKFTKKYSKSSKSKGRKVNGKKKIYQKGRNLCGNVKTDDRKQAKLSDSTAKRFKVKYNKN